MNQSIHQVNHPGKELNISYGNRNNHTKDYYFLPGSILEGVRLWNRRFINLKPNSHKRKFIEHEGKYIKNINAPIEMNGLLRFWGEYEGHSRFTLLNSQIKTHYWDNPSAVHKPFFCPKNINDQNTDPYIFGKNFYYAICKKSDLKDIRENDIILFGSEFGAKENVKFYLDSVIVIEKEQNSIIDNSLYDDIYIESTLKRIGLSQATNGTMPIHIGKKYSHQRKQVFSFFPAKIAENLSFGRPIIDTVKLGLKKPGARTGSKSRKLKQDEFIEIIWQDIANEVINQGFVLGTHANTLPIFNNLP